MVKPAVAATGHPLSVESWPIVLNYNAIGPTPRLLSPRTCPQRMEGSRQMPPWGVVALLYTHQVLSRAPEKHGPVCGVLLERWSGR